MGHPSLRDSMKGTWREGSLAGYPEGYVEKDLETGISFHRGLIGEPVRRLIYNGLWKKDDRGSRDGASHSEEAQRDGLEGGLFYWGPWKTSYIGFGYGNHHRGPFTAEQNLESGRRFIYWGLWKSMKEGSSNGTSLSDGLHEGDLQGGLPCWGPQKMLRLWKWVSASIGGLLLGNIEGHSLLRVFRRK